MSEIALSGDRPESSLQIWGQLLDSLRRSGFREAGPEYLKLSKLVTEVRRHQVLSGPHERDEATWQKLSELGGEAFTLLSPLTEAARLLAELPLKVSITLQPPVLAPPVLAATSAAQAPSGGVGPARQENTPQADPVQTPPEHAAVEAIALSDMAKPAASGTRSRRTRVPRKTKECTTTTDKER